MAVSTYENIPETLDRALRSTRNREIDRVELLCSPDALTKPHPMCTTRVERFLYRLHHACTATVFLPSSECFVGVARGFPLSVKPSTSGWEPRHRRALPHRHSRSVK